MTLETPAIVLASASPRRSALLRQIGVPHAVLVANVDEARSGSESPREHVQRLAAAKAQRGYELQPASASRLSSLGADTIVTRGDAIFGKPQDQADAQRMLLELSDVTHQVMTAVALANDAGCSVRLSVSELRFRVIQREEAARYWASGEPRDKAGGYAIQGYGAVFVASLRGSYSGVVGLPLFETAELLATAGIACRPAAAGRA